MNDASDWEYTSEGGRHALFAYKSASGPLERWTGRLLRIDKSILRAAQLRVRTVDNVLSNAEERVEDGFDVMVHAALSPYVDLPVKVLLSWDFVAELREHTVRSGRVPILRRIDWNSHDCPGCINEYSAPAGYLLRDYRSFRSSDVLTAALSNAVVSWEIKPKAGYTAISPLVAVSRHEKFTRSRFHLLQQVYVDGKVTKGWMNAAASGTYAASVYDPLDLFSACPDRIRRGLRHLMTSPHNNLKLWMGGDILVHGASTAKSPDWSALWESLGVIDETGVLSDGHRMIDIVTHILYEEPFLSTLLRLQKLDVIDADGAIAVYRRLVHLCDGDCDRADQLMDHTPPIVQCNSPINENEMTAWNGTLWRRPPFAPNLDALHQEIEAFQRLLETSRPTVPKHDVRAESRRRALDIVGQLTRDESCYLLQTWLLSLTMSDLSFFVTLRPAVIDAHTTSQWSEKTDDSIRLISHQQRDAPGCVAFRVNEATKTWVALNYELKAIDIDRKPARKLRSREAKELHFDVP